VGLSGFLMGGGYGWNSRHLGPACLSITAADVVLADGRLTRADDTSHADLIWAVRGCGPGFFGVVTRYHLRLYPQPGTIARSTQVYPLGTAEEVTRWCMDLAPSFAPSVELVAMATPPPIPGYPAAALTVSATAFAGSEAAAAALLAPLERLPARARPVLHETAAVTSLAELAAEVDRETPKGLRYVCDNMWTTAGAGEIAPLVGEIIRAMPNIGSQVFLYWWGEDQDPGNACWSSQAPWYLAVYGIWDDPALDGTFTAWVRDSMRGADRLSAGTQFADADLEARFDRPLSAASLARLDRLRRDHDPGGLFHGYLPTGPGPASLPAR
jgi:FAD/FMN-containing dehydrogenase